MQFTISWQDILIVVVLATAVYLIENVLLSRWSGRNRQNGAGRREWQQVRADIDDLRRRLEQLEQPRGSAGTTFDGYEAPAYDHAIQFARQGLSPIEIAGRCGISRDEAALIIALHGRHPHV